MSIGSVNKVILVGRTGQDIDLRYTQNGTPVGNISVATNERYKNTAGEWEESTEWHRVVLWGKLAEIVNNYMPKGSRIYVEGRIKTRKWQDNDGQTRYITEIIASNIQNLSDRPQQQDPSQQQPQQAPQQMQQPQQAPQQAQQPQQMQQPQQAPQQAQQPAQQQTNGFMPDPNSVSDDQLFNNDMPF